ncbi:MAG TPA: aminopeptidase [Alphaproteobacteria bacterium]|nr:aminopeptidase [Alphaproteobacteria bacterium]
MVLTKAFGRGALACVLLVLTACSVRSISDSGYREPGYGHGNPIYRGELSEYAVLGIDPAGTYSEADIQKAMIERRPLSVKKGSGILLVQSGAEMADPEMTAALEKYYTVAVFSGVPQQGKPMTPYSQLFRMAAAKGGYGTVIVYWGVLESASQGLGGKAISWLPVIGGIVPDENQQMRIRLTMAVIDTSTGQWESFSPEPFADEAMSNGHGRAASDQRQVMTLKAKAYTAAAEAVALKYGR